MGNNQAHPLGSVASGDRAIHLRTGVLGSQVITWNYRWERKVIPETWKLWKTVVKSPTFFCYVLVGVAVMKNQEANVERSCIWMVS